MILEQFCFGDSLPDAYHKALRCLHEYGDISDCKDWGMKQLESSMTMEILEPLKEPMISKLFIGGPEELEQYRQEMLYGILDFEVEKGNWKYTYHDRMVNYPIKLETGMRLYGNKRKLFGVAGFDQVEFVINELKRNPSSRRAVINIRSVDSDAFSDDPACLQHIQYFIRDGKLHCKVLFRSNDACKATFMNAFALIKLQQEIAEKLCVEVGTYTHRANSFHCYEKDFGMLDGFVNRIDKAKDKYDICFDYEDGWKDDMEELSDKIANKVEVLKNNG